MYWPSKTSTPSQSEIFSLSARTNKRKANGVQAIRQNISVWEGVLVLEGQYIHMSRENKTLETEYFWPIDTYEQREREGGVHTILLCGKTLFGLPFSKIQLLELVMMMCGYVTGSEKLFIGNQID